MQTNNLTYDFAIIGGGLAGLCLAIQLKKSNYTVVLFEKNEYPFHKVCGEYVSNESWSFLEELGVPLSKMSLPKINQLGVTSSKGYLLEAPLQMGGFGISRYELDYQLAKLAKEFGVMVYERCKVNNVVLEGEINSIDTSNGKYYAKKVCGSYGKINPLFINKSSKPYSNTYIGVKYHIKTNLNANRIELHNFKDGYCGISKVDNEKYCLCYITTAKNLNKCNNDIKQLEKDILFKNPYLKDYFIKSEFLNDKPLTISQISFKKKKTFTNGIFLLGDAAGAIAPLCGNGMSMAMRTSKFLAAGLDNLFNNRITEAELIKSYNKEWNRNFSTRINAGYYLQKLMGKVTLTHLSLKILNNTPRFLQRLIRLTHGSSF
jgi:flavin-dependent dehydrogenase